MEPLVTVALVRSGEGKPWKDDVVGRDTRESRRLLAGSRCSRLRNHGPTGQGTWLGSVILFLTS